MSRHSGTRGRGLGRSVLFTASHADPVAGKNCTDCYGWPDSADCTAEMETAILPLVIQGVELSDRLPLVAGR